MILLVVGMTWAIDQILSITGVVMINKPEFNETALEVGGGGRSDGGVLIISEKLSSVAGSFAM